MRQVNLSTLQYASEKVNACPSSSSRNFQKPELGCESESARGRSPSFQVQSPCYGTKTVQFLGVPDQGGNPEIGF